MVRRRVIEPNLRVRVDVITGLTSASMAVNGSAIGAGEAATQALPPYEPVKGHILAAKAAHQDGDTVVAASDNGGARQNGARIVITICVCIGRGSAAA